MKATISSYWDIAASHMHLPHAERVSALVMTISALPVFDIVEFHHFVSAHQRKAQTEHFFMAATLMYNCHGYYTTDHFNAVTAWLVFQGRDIYSLALQNPDSLGQIICDLTAPEEFLTICATAYKEKTGLHNFEEICEAGTYQGRAALSKVARRNGFVEPEKIRLLFPNLYAKYQVLNPIPEEGYRTKYDAKKARKRNLLIFASTGILLLVVLIMGITLWCFFPMLVPPIKSTGVPSYSEISSTTTLSGHTGNVFSVAWSPDGNTLASGSADGTVKVWNVERRECLTTLEAHTDAAWVGQIAWSPDGRRLATAADDNTIKVWDASTWKTIEALSGHSQGPTALAWSGDSQTLFSGSWDNSVKSWHIMDASCVLTMTGHSSVVFGVSVSPNGKLIASGSRDSTLRIWDASTGECKALLSGDDGVVNGVSWSADSKFVACANGNNHVQIWNISNGNLDNTLVGHTDPVTAVSWSPDGKWLASCSDDFTVRVWDPTTGQCLVTLNHGAILKGLAWRWDSKRLASSGFDHNIKIWDIPSILNRVRN